MLGSQSTMNNTPSFFKREARFAIQVVGLAKWWNPRATPAMSKLWNSGPEIEGCGSGEQRSATDVLRTRDGWVEERREVYCDSMAEEMSMPVAWVMCVLKA